MKQENIKLGPGMALAALKKLFNDKEVKELYEGKRVGTIDIEITDKCNYQCKYCYGAYSPKGNSFTKNDDRLTDNEIKKTLDEAASLDIRLFNIQGGEPTINMKRFFDIAEYARPQFKSLVAFTNGSLFSEKDIQRIRDLNMALCVKLDTLNPEVFKQLTGRPSKDLERTLKNLKQLKDNEVTVSTNCVATPLNYESIPKVWRYATAMGFTPFVARNHYHGATRDNPYLQLSANELGNLFEELQKIDKEEFGIRWSSSVIWPRGNSCQRYRAGVFVNHKGDVLPCSEADPKYFKLGNVKEQALKEIVSEENLKPFRNIYDKLHGACAVDVCDFAKEQKCYGCRVSAGDVGLFRGKDFTENFYGGDALCVHNKINPLIAKELGREEIKNPWKQ